MKREYTVTTQTSKHTVTVGLTTRSMSEGRPDRVTHEVLLDIDLYTGQVRPGSDLVDRIAKEVDPYHLDLVERINPDKLTKSIVYSEYDEMFGYDDYLVYVDDTDEYVHPLTAQEHTYVVRGNRKWKQDEWTGEEHAQH